MTCTSFVYNRIVAAQPPLGKVQGRQRLLLPVEDFQPIRALSGAAS